MNSFHAVPALAFWGQVAWWMAVALVVLVGLVQWRRGRRSWGWFAVGAVLIVGSGFWLSARGDSQADARRQPPVAAKPLSPQSQAVMSIVVARCQACHSDHATKMRWASFGLSLNNMDDVDRAASRIYKQVVELQAMPMGNATQMTADERATIAKWYESRAQ